MILKKEINHLLSRKMERKEFLAFLGAIALGVIGVSGLLRTLRDARSQYTRTRRRPVAKKQLASGYGASSYGR